HASADHTPAFDHLLEIDADKVILADDAFMPTEIIPVDGTVFDFRKQAPVRQLLATHNNGRPLSASRGYNHAFVLNQKKDRTESPILCFTSPKEDLVLQMYTDAPCAVFYSGGFIDHSYTLSDGSRSGPSCAFAFEMQDYPDASGGHGFPFRITKAGTVWKRWIRWNFLSSQPVTLLS
ncbi:MAG: hypothetical protein Q4B09_02660, partial [Lachnospiraceae bacterium]|nr:hypothetical protein [Lachnospiraceae bacterium]